METFDDFWRMMWEQMSSVIVMLTKLEERGRVRFLCRMCTAKSFRGVGDFNCITVEPPLTVVSLQRPGFFVLIHRSVHFTLIKTSLQRPPLYNGLLIQPQGGRCREVELCNCPWLLLLWYPYSVLVDSFYIAKTRSLFRSRYLVLRITILRWSVANASCLSRKQTNKQTNNVTQICWFCKILVKSWTSTAFQWSESCRRASLLNIHFPCITQSCHFFFFFSGSVTSTGLSVVQGITVRFKWLWKKRSTCLTTLSGSL